MNKIIKIVIVALIICLTLPNANAGLFSERTINLVDKKLGSVNNQNNHSKKEAKQQLITLIEKDNYYNEEEMRSRIISNFCYLQIVLDKKYNTNYVLYTDNPEWLQQWDRENSSVYMGTYINMVDLVTGNFLNMSDEEVKEKFDFVIDIFTIKNKMVDKTIYTLYDEKTPNAEAFLIKDQKNTSLKLKYTDYTSP